MNSDLNDVELNLKERSRCHTWPAKQFGFCFENREQQSSSAATMTLPSGSKTASSPVCTNADEQQHQSKLTLDSQSSYPTTTSSTNNSVQFGQQQQSSSPQISGASSSQYFETIPDGSGFYGLSGSDGNICSLKMKKKRVRRKPSDVVCQKKPNPWGEESYSDLIARALESAPEKRMKLSDIYQWFSVNIPYFRERSSSEEAAGWKVSFLAVFTTFFFTTALLVTYTLGLMFLIFFLTFFV